jgi:hypothetical protein
MSQFVCEAQRDGFRASAQFVEPVSPATELRLDDFEARTESSDGTSATLRIKARVLDEHGGEMPLGGRLRVERADDWCISGERDGFEPLLRSLGAIAMRRGWSEWGSSRPPTGGEWIAAEAAPGGPGGPPEVGGALVTTASGLTYIDIEPGDGAIPEEGQTLVLHYTLWLEASGRRIDGSSDRGRPFEFTLGDGLVVEGFEEGLATMREGGRRRLIVPPKLGYGRDDDYADIPLNSTLVFDVELLEVR